jgi:hypothetical protein
MQFTRAQLANLVGNHNSGGFPGNILQAASELSTSEPPEVSEKQWFQVLLVDVDDSGISTTKIVYGEKSRLEAEYGISGLPSNGIEVASGFISPGELRAKYSSVRFLLQCRKLSQMMVLTWVNENEVPNEQKLEVKLIREIFHAYNVIPDTFFLSQQGLNPISSIRLTQNILQAEENNVHDVSYLIKPGSTGYSSIRLVLLLCGQAYYKTPTMQQYSKIGASIPGLESGIFSTYEMIWEYAMDVSWDSFYATRIDISQSGLNPNPPFTQVTLGYPARPSEFNVTQTQIQEWALASDSEGSLPFYPPTGTPEWEQTKIKYIVPPYPYLPLSCS